MMYRTIAQIDATMASLARLFPQIFSRVLLPEHSVDGRSVYALRMRAGGGGARRAVLIVGGTHARELMNPDAIIELAGDLLVSYARGTDLSYGGKTFPAGVVKLLLDAMDIWLLPCVNPDGRHYVMTVDDMWRKNRRDNPGTSCDGVDLNRNADLVWGVAQGQTSCSPCSDVYCGPTAFSEPETRNVKHLLDTARVVSFVDVHSFSELVLYPWGHAPTQSSDPSQQFTSLATGTCTASIPAAYSEYMPPQDVQRFQSVADRIVADIAEVRGRHYTPQTGLGLYATTGTQSDYVYSRHIANPSLNKTYGFTFETGPSIPNNPRESFHPADPTLVKQDAKAAMLALVQQSLCAIELIGQSLFGDDTELIALRKVRDEFLASTAAGRAWITLFERLQFVALSAVVSDTRLMEDSGELLKLMAREIDDRQVLFTPEHARLASSVLKRLRTVIKDRIARDDLNGVAARIDQVIGLDIQHIVESLMRYKPGQSMASSRAKNEKAKAKAKKVIGTGKKAAVMKTAPKKLPVKKIAPKKSALKKTTRK